MLVCGTKNDVRKFAVVALFQRESPASTSLATCKAGSITVPNESSLYWYGLLRLDRFF